MKNKKRKIFLAYAEADYNGKYFPTTTLHPDERDIYSVFLGGDWFIMYMFGKPIHRINFFLLCAAANDEL